MARGDTGKGEPYTIIYRWILEEKISDRAKLLYAWLNHHAGQNEFAWPSRRTLAEELGCHPNSVDRALTELKDVGAIVTKSRYRKDGSNTSLTYLVWPKLTLEGDAPTHHGGHPSQSVVTQEETTVNRQHLNIIDDDEFEQVWAAYPRGTSKGQAKIKFKATLKSGAHFNDLLVATNNYAGVRRLANEPQFTMEAKRFFGPNEEWRDYVDGGAGLTLVRHDPEAQIDDIEARRRQQVIDEEHRREREIFETKTARAPMPESLKSIARRNRSPQ